MSADAVRIQQLEEELFHCRQALKSLQEGRYPAAGESENRPLSAGLLAVQETVLRRISRELHDDLGGALSLLKLRCGLIGKKLEKEIGEAFHQNLELIDQIIEMVHRLSRDLSPAIIEDLGFTPAIRWLIEDFAGRHQIKAVSEITEAGSTLAKDHQVQVYRIIQETLANVGRHAGARHVTIRMIDTEDALSFSVGDDGRGFDAEVWPAIPAPGKGIGLATMDARARMIGGSIELWSREGKGTRMTLLIPKKDEHR